MQKAEPQYETIEKDELTDKDTIIETIVEPAKTEEKENEKGEKETVEIRTSQRKIQNPETSGCIKRHHSAVEQASERVHR